MILGAITTEPKFRQLNFLLIIDHNNTYKKIMSTCVFEGRKGSSDFAG